APMARAAPARAASPPAAGRAPALPGARSDPVGVENGVDVAEAGDRLVERAGVPHFDHESVFDHRVVDGAACLEDVDPGFGERPGHVLQETVSIPAIDLDLYPEGGLRVAVPGHRCEALG